MRNVLLLGAFCAAATMLLATGDTQPLNVKTGVWRVTMTTTINGMGQPQTHTYDSCVTQDDLGKYPFADPDNHCKYTVVSSTGSQMDANGTCAPGGEGTVTFNLQLQAVDSENVKGTGHLTMSGQGGSMDGNYSAKAKWVGPSCSAGAK